MFEQTFKNIDDVLWERGRMRDASWITLSRALFWIDSSSTSTISSAPTNRKPNWRARSISQSSMPNTVGQELGNGHRRKKMARSTTRRLLLATISLNTLMKSCFRT